MIFLPSWQVIEIIMNPPKSLAVIVNPLRFKPLCCKLPQKRVPVVEIKITRVIIYILWLWLRHCAALVTRASLFFRAHSHSNWPLADRNSAQRTEESTKSAHIDIILFLCSLLIDFCTMYTTWIMSWCHMYAFDPNEEDRNESFLWCYGWKEACTHSFMFVSILLNGQLFVWMLYTEYTRYNSK